MGWDPEAEPRLLTFALVYDLTARARSQKWQSDRIDAKTGKVLDRGASKRLYDEWARKASPEAMAALTR